MEHLAESRQVVNGVYENTMAAIISLPLTYLRCSNFLLKRFSINGFDAQFANVRIHYSVQTRSQAKIVRMW